MAVLNVKIASIIGVVSALDDVVEICGKSQVFHPDNALSFYSNTKKFTPFSTNNKISEPLKNLKDIVAKVGQTLEFVDINGFKASKKDMIEYVDRISKGFKDFIDEQQRIVSRLNEYYKTLEQIKPFIGLNIDFEKISTCNYIKARFGRLPRSSYEKLNSQKANPYVLFFPCTSNDEYLWGVYFSPIEYIEDTDRIFTSLYFERIRISERDGTPELKINQIEKNIEKEKSRLAEIDIRIEEFWKKQKSKCMKVYTKLEELNIYVGIKKQALKYHNNFILVGWIPEENEMEFANSLDKIRGIEYAIDKVDKEKDYKPPIKLKNNWFSKPFETFVSMYGLPQYREIDPTFFVAITYTTIYGLMFGDLGHGIILAALGALLWKIKRFSLGKIMLRCGISASIFGIIFGSVFGYEHLLDPFYKKVFGMTEKPIDVMSPDMIMNVIAGAIGLGVVLIITAMILKIYSSFKMGDVENALFGSSGLAGLIFYVSVIYAAISQVLLGRKTFTLVYITCFMVLPLILIFLKEPLAKLIMKDPNWKPESLGEYLLQNVFEMLVVILEYVTNTISFLRVGAYVLVHAGLMMAVFMIAEMFPSAAVAIIVFGNLFVIALEGLLVGIQVLRLEFYEMFSRFFEGSGDKFEPVMLPVKNKH